MDKILVIDDEESARELLKLTLEADGFQVCTAEDGWKGLTVYETSQPEVVLTDIKMPGIDGIEVLRRLKQLNPDVEVIVITGHGEMELAIQALQLEASDFINKPISDQALSIALRRAREKIWMRRKLRDYTTNLECMLKEATEEIRKRHDFEHELIHTSMDGIIANDPKGNIIIYNEGAERICGYSQEEAKCYMTVAQLYPAGEAQKVKSKIMGPECGGPGRLINYETHLFAKDGRIIPILLSASVIYEDGREVATVGFFKDLAEVKRLQQELLNKTRMAAIGEAMTEVAHSVKNILYGMKLGAFTLNKGLARADLEPVRKGWQTVQKNIDRISQFSLDMLDYAREERKRRDPVSINELVRDVCGSLGKQFESAGVMLEQDLQNVLPTIRGDAAGLHTCILNLITNSLEAFPENAAEKRIIVRTGSRPNGQLYLEVSDTGKGMIAELQEQIFKPLFSTKGARGTGLGLAITEKIVQHHHGAIQLWSQPHKGSTFTIVLPAQGIEQPAQEPYCTE
ncbi:MAG: response regulator [Desulforhabdus sp.]|nr:response regulator [Desulforhabdus sp.]